MPRPLAKIFLLILYVFPSACLGGEKISSLEGPDVIVLFDESLRSGALEISTLYPSVRTHLEKTFGWPFTFNPTILLVKDRENFQRAAGSSLVVAFAVPHKNLIVIDHSRMIKDPFSIEVTLRHELCHLLLHSYLRRDRMPKWLDEGIAQWVSGGIGEFALEQKESLLNRAVLTGRLLDISGLFSTFPGDAESFSLAYQESRSLVDFIVDQHGREGLVAVLRQLQDHDIEHAVKLSLSISFDELETEWLHHLKARLTWFTWLANNLYEVLFFVGGVILMLGFLRRLSKKRAYMNDGEDDFPDT